MTGRSEPGLIVAGELPEVARKWVSGVGRSAPPWRRLDNRQGFNQPTYSGQTIY
jgi:hypothetical protein